MAYRREDIERVREATDLVELITEVTKVKQSGRSVMAICPFHQEKTPSLSIDRARGLYHCFGCGKSGDLFTWVQESQGLEFAEAVELLARRAGIPLERDPEAARQRSAREQMIAAMRETIDFYRERLSSAPDAGPARAYLRARGYNRETVQQFGLGYSPAGWDELSRHLRGRGLSEKVMTGAGLVVRSRRGRLVDRFRGRVMFPVFDVRGDPVGFGARQLEGEGPKYLNSPETPLYRKARLLYGLNWSKSEIVRNSHAVVVEGYTDVIGMHEAGMPVAVATCGTALGTSHLDLLRRFTDRAILAFDADVAGAGASVRGFDQAVPGELDLRVALLPEGKDPADLVSDEEVHLLRKAVEDSQPLMSFRIAQELERFDLSEPEARARAIRAGAGVIARHPDRLSRREYAVELSRATGVDLGAVEDAIEAAVEPAPPSDPQAEVGRRLSGTEKAELELLRLLLANDPRLRSYELYVDVFTVPDHRRAFEVLAPAVAALDPGEPPDVGALVGEEEPGLLELLGPLTVVGRPLADPGEVIRKLQVGGLDRRIEEKRRELEQTDPEAEAEAYAARFEELMALEQERHRERSPS